MPTPKLGGEKACYNFHMPAPLLSQLLRFLTQLQSNKACLYDPKGKVNASYSGTLKKYLGIKMPCLRALVKDFKKCCFAKATSEDQIALLDSLFSSSVHEHYILAAMLLGSSKPLLRELNWDKLFRWLEGAEGWEEVDQYAYLVLGEKFLYEFSKDPKALDKIVPQLEILAKSKKPELKRGAVVVLIKAIRKANTAELSRIRSVVDKLFLLGDYLDSKDPLLKKAVAWVRREFNKKMLK